MSMTIDPAVAELFPGLRLYATKPLHRTRGHLDTTFAEDYKLSSAEIAAYTAFRKKRELLARSKFLLAVETYKTYRAPDATAESQIREVSAATRIPFGILPTRILKDRLTLRFSRSGERLAPSEDESIELPPNCLVLCNETTILGHFSVQGSQQLKPETNDSICIISYIPDTQVSSHKIKSCLRLLEEQLTV